jgi:hypothetical protein
MSISRAFRRPGRAELVEQREAALHRRAKLVDQFGEVRRDDASLVIQDKHRELHGSSFYSTGRLKRSTPSSQRIRQMNLTLPWL